MNNLFPDFPGTARLWFYFFSRSLKSEAMHDLHAKLKAFLREWHSHKEDVRGAYECLENQLVIICAQHEDLSGCSIDSSVKIFKAFKAEKDMDALDRSLIFFRDKNRKIRSMTRLQFADLYKNREIDGKTVVFDTLHRTLRDMREKGLEKKLSESWQAKLLS